MKLWDLYRGRDYRIEPTLERIKRAAEYVGNPQRSYPAILVGGTNGKGSTCAFLERILREHGYKTGWFVSPHLVEENERWRINGNPVEDKVLSAYVKELRGVFERFDLTYFEAATLIALVYFKEAGVEVAVFEVGMGGRWDATKVSDAVAVCITNVERDHTRWLGRNLEEIARDKLNLWREGVPLVLGSSRYPLYPVALEMGIKDPIVGGIDFTYGGGSEGGRTILREYSFDGLRVEEAQLGLLGKWQVDNAALALTLARVFFKPDTDKLKAALRDARWEGRMEVLREKPLLLVDGSHNPYSVGKVVKEVKKLFGDVNFLFTGLIEKDWRLSMEVIRRYSDRIILVQISHYRGEPIESLREHARKLGFKEVKVLGSPSEVWLLEEDVCAIGSLYLVGEIKGTLQNAVI